MIMQEAPTRSKFEWYKRGFVGGMALASKASHCGIFIESFWRWSDNEWSTISLTNEFGVRLWLRFRYGHNTMLSMDLCDPDTFKLTDSAVHEVELRPFEIHSTEQMEELSVFCAENFIMLLWRVQGITEEESLYEVLQID